MANQKRKYVLKGRRKFISINEEETILIKSAKDASFKAKRISSVLGITFKIIKEGELLEI